MYFKQDTSHFSTYRPQASSAVESVMFSFLLSILKIDELFVPKLYLNTSFVMCCALSCISAFTLLGNVFKKEDTALFCVLFLHFAMIS